MCNINFNPWYEEKDAGSFKKTSKGVTDGVAGSKKNKAGILLQGKIKKRREAFGALSFFVKIYRTFDCFLIEKW